MVRIVVAATFALSSPASAAPKKHADVPAAFPRVELYTEADLGDPAAGSDTHIDPDGKRHGMGRAESRPFIRRCELILDAATRSRLRDTKLAFLPYFREQKPETTIGAFIDAMASGRDELKRALLPRSLEGFLTHPKHERQTFATLVDPETSERSLTVVWLDDEHWYVDSMFYRSSGLDVAKLARGGCVDLFQGSFSDFLRYSPLVAPRRTEGLSQLQHPAFPRPTPHRAPVIELSKSPGISNDGFHMTVFDDGVFRLTYGGPDAGRDPHRLTGLLLEARRLGVDRQPDHGPGPRPPADDQQVTILRLHTDRGTVSHEIGPGTSPLVLQFVRDVLTRYGIAGE